VDPVIPSAELGMIVPGGARQRDMTVMPLRDVSLPSRMSEGVQNTITSGQNFQTNNNSSANSSVNNAATLNYSPQITGYHPYRSRSDFEGMLRTHGGSLMRWAETVVRNGYSPNRSF